VREAKTKTDSDQPRSPAHLAPPPPSPLLSPIFFQAETAEPATAPPPPPPAKVSPHFRGDGAAAPSPKAKKSPAAAKAATKKAAPAAKKGKAPPKAKANALSAKKKPKKGLASDDEDEPSSEEEEASDSEFEASASSSSSDDDDEMDVDASPAGRGKGKGSGKGKAVAAKAKAPAPRRRAPAKKEKGEDEGEMVVLLSSDDDDDGHTPSPAPARGRAKAPAPKPTPTAGAANKRKAPASAGPSSPAAAGTAAKRTPAAKRPKSALPSAPPAVVPGAAEAQAAVQAAIAALPAEPVYSLLDEGAGQWGRAEDEPPNAGRVPPPPRAHPDCMAGLTFVISGTLDSLHREAASDHIRGAGGRVTGSVSGKTSFLLVGAGTGRTKFNQAKAKKTKLLDEAGLRALLAAAPFDAAARAAADAAAEAAAEAAAAKAASASPAPASARAPTAGPGAAAAAGAGPRPPPQPAPPGGGLSSLWVDKYRPTSTADLVGNPGAVGDLKAWLADWEAVHLRGGRPAHMPAKAGKGKAAAAFAADYGKKAVLLSGGPGVGKTSAALAVALEAGYTPVEVNASDTRNQADKSARSGVGGKLANAIKEMTTNASLPGGSAVRRTLLIMDEVDGMSAGDRGGVTDLIATVKASRIPIICIANDKHAAKLKALRGHVLELDFAKPNALAVAKRLAGVCAAEGLQAGAETLKALAESANCDVRALLGQLQFVRLRKRALAFDDAKGGGKFSVAKDMALTPFEASRRLFDSAFSRVGLGARLDLALADADLVPLLVQENYLNHTPTTAGGDMHARLRLTAKAADLISEGDLVSRAVRMRQQWSLLPFSAVLSSAGPGAIMRGAFHPFGLYPGEPNFPRFAAWFGLNSTAGKQRRLLGELAARLNASGKCDADRSAVRADYAPALAAAIVAPLAGDDPDVQAAAAALTDYGLTKDDFDYLLDVTTFKKAKAAGGAAAKAAAAFKGLPGPTKAAFTRAITTAAPLPRWNADAPAFTRTKGGKGGKAAVGAKKKARAPSAGEGGEEEGEEGGEEEGGRARSGTGAGSDDDDDDDLPPDVVAARLAARLKADGVEFSAPAAGKAGGSGAAKGKGKAAAKGKGKGK
jgi:replication factor C subunit 1